MLLHVVNKEALQLPGSSLPFRYAFSCEELASHMLLNEQDFFFQERRGIWHLCCLFPYVDHQPLQSPTVRFPLSFSLLLVEASFFCWQKIPPTSWESRPVKTSDFFLPKVSIRYRDFLVPTRTMGYKSHHRILS